MLFDKGYKYELLLNEELINREKNMSQLEELVS